MILSVVALSLLSGAYAQSVLGLEVPEALDAAAVAGAPASASDACARTAELDSLGFRYSFQSDAAGAKPVEMEFKRAACYVHDRDSDGDPVEPPEAVRWYQSDYRNFGMIVETVPGGASRFSLIQYSDSRRLSFLNSGYIGNAPYELSQLAAGVSVPNASVALFYPKYESWKGNARLSIAPTLKAVIEVADAWNKTREDFSIFSASAGGVTTYYLARKGEMERATLRGDDTLIETDGGIEESTPSRVLAKYGAEADGLVDKGTSVTTNGQVTFTLKSGRCSPFEAALLMFWIDEYFYFG
jgi:hypothetical protein